MTKQEALSFLDKCRWWFEPYTGDPKKWHEAVNMAIEALQKSIPKPPKKDKEDNLLCPLCGEDVDWHKYCEECGQAIEWE